MTAERPLRVAVIGGGIAGMACAIGLQQSGHAPVVFERTPSLRLAGGALLVWPPALEALEELGVAGAVLDAGTRLHVMEIRSFRGDLITTLQLANVGKGKHAGCVLVRRSALLRILAERAAVVPTRFGMQALRIATDENLARVTFGSGEELAFDLVIGADGIHSMVRTFVQGEQPLRPGGRTAWVGIVPAAHPLLETGVVVNSVGQGVSFLAVGMEQGMVYWYATVTDLRGPPSVERLVERLAGCHEPACDLVLETPPEHVVATEIRDRRPVSPWSRGRVTLVGDAAHPCAPDLGQGACQAIESAGSLVRQLGHSRREAVFPGSLAAYEAERFERCCFVTAVSRGTLFHDLLDDPVMTRSWGPVARWGFPFVMPELLEWLASGDARAPGSRNAIARTRSHSTGSP